MALTTISVEGSGATVGVLYLGSLVTVQKSGYYRFPPRANCWGTIHLVPVMAPRPLAEEGGHHPKKMQTREQSTLAHPLISVVVGRKDIATCQLATSLPHGPGCSRAPIGLTRGLLDTG
jgi:hypothetical protein